MEPRGVAVEADDAPAEGERAALQRGRLAAAEQRRRRAQQAEGLGGYGLGLGFGLGLGLGLRFGLGFGLGMTSGRSARGTAHRACSARSALSTWEIQGRYRGDMGRDRVQRAQRAKHLVGVGVRVGLGLGLG